MQQKPYSAAVLPDDCRKKIPAAGVLLRGTGEACPSEVELFAVAVVFDDVIDVFVSASGTGRKDGAVGMLLRPFDSVGDGMGAFQCRNDALVAGEHEESLYCFFVGGCDIFHTFEIVPEGVFRTDSLIVESACDGVDRCGFAFVIGEDVGFKTVELARFAVSDRCRMIAEARTFAEGFDSVEIHGIVQIRA